jgi:hypothetical protein
MGCRPTMTGGNKATISSVDERHGRSSIIDYINLKHDRETLGYDLETRSMIDLLMLIVLAAAFAGAAGYVRLCSRFVGQRNPSSDKAP